MANLDRDIVNRDLSKIQQIASQFGIDDINNIDSQTRQTLIERLEKELGGQRQRQIGSTIRDIGGIWSQGKEYIASPQTGEVRAVDVSAGGGAKQPSQLDELITYEKYKALTETRQEKERKRGTEQAILRAKKDILGEPEPKPEPRPEPILEPSPIPEPSPKAEPTPLTIDKAPTPISEPTPISRTTTAPPIPRKKIIKEITLSTGETELAEIENINYEQEKEAYDLWKKQEAEPRGKARTKWFEEGATREIKFEVIDPKLRYYMDVGGRAYQELRDEVKDKWGMDLNFEEGGVEAWKARLSKNVAMFAKLAPLMFALERLRPELGTELMRQLGAFRSAQMARQFANTLSQFSGDIREDIANMTTTMAKNVANIELIDENGNTISTEETVERMLTAEANLIRIYNKMYRHMGLTTKPYTAKRSLEWLAKNSNFNEAEENIIQNAMADNPGNSRTEIAAKLIEEGLV